MADSLRTNYLILLGVLVFLAITLRFFWNMYFNKYYQLKKFTTQKNNELYFLSTLHNLHLKKWTHYSLEDILNVVKNLKPDTVLIEAREEYFKDYGVVDGAVEMAVVYAYCTENNIPVKFIDWWKVDNNYQVEQKTKDKKADTKRNDMMFKNITKHLKANEKTLLICGRLAATEQSVYFKNNNFAPAKISHRKKLFESTETFTYPESLEEVWEKRAHFYAYEYAQKIHDDKKLTDEVKAKFPLNNEGFFNWQKRYCILFKQNKLHI